jgi:hypothetical protein
MSHRAFLKNSFYDFPRSESRRTSPKINRLAGNLGNFGGAKVRDTLDQ